MDERRDFTLRQLETFVCAARAGNFARAADTLGISQPAVSDQIAALERRLGKRLFARRRGKPPLLTPDGIDLLQKAENLLSTSRAMRADAPVERTERVRVRLCIGPRLRDVYLKPILPRLYREHPEIELDMVPLLARGEVQSALEEGAIDLVVYSVGEPIASWPNLRLVCDVPTVLIAAPGTGARLQSGAVMLAELAFILPPTANLSEHWLERQLDRLGYRSNLPVRYVDFTDVIEQMVADGAGISVLMHEQVAAAIAAGRIEALPLPFPPMRRVTARSRAAPLEARIVEDYLIQAFGAGAEKPPQS
jgi:LysR family hydrogen peroxide-inducible transcriptional activator